MEVDAVRAELGELVNDFDRRDRRTNRVTEGSRPWLPTVQRPKVKCWAGVGV